jgi:chromosome partitioning protein
MKVLAIDLDPQANMTMGLASLSLAREDHPTLRDVLIEKEPIEKVVKKLTPLLHLIPANLSLSSLERKLQSENNRDRKLKKFLNEIKNQYDLIIVDTSPAASLVNVNAFVAADEICVVSATEYLSTSGLTSFFELLEDLQNDFGIEPSVRIIPNQFDVRNGMDQESLGLLRRDWSEFLVTSVIRKNIDIREAHKLRQSLWIYRKSSTAAEDLDLLAKELFNEPSN